MDRNGAPVPFVPATVSITWEPSDADVRLEVGDAARSSDADGYVSLRGTALTTSSPGVDITVIVRSRGSPGNTTAEIRMELVRRRLQDVLQAFALLLIVLFIPLFLSSVAYSRKLYLWSGLAYAIAMAAAVVAYARVAIPEFEGNQMVQTFITLLAIVAVVTAVFVLCMTVMQLLSRTHPRLRVWNAEERATSAFLYTVWLVGARVDKQPIETELSITQRLSAFAKAAKARVVKAFATSSDDDDDDDGETGPGEVASGSPNPSKAAKIESEASTTTLARSNATTAEDDEELAAMQPTSVGEPEKAKAASDSFESALERQERQQAVDDGDAAGFLNPYATVERPALVKPDDVPDPTYHPVNLFVVLSITIVLLLVVVFATVQIMFDAEKLLTRATNALPRAPDDPDAARNATRKLTQALVVSIDAVAASDPSLSSLREVIGPLQEFDWVTALSDVRRYIAGVNERIVVSFSVGMTFGTLFVILCMIYIWYVTPNIIRKMRRGLYHDVPVYNDPEPFRIEQFVGLFVFHFVALYIMVSFVVMCIVLLLSVAVIRNWIFWQVYAALLTSLGSLIATFAMRFFQQLFLMDGTFVVRPRIYAAYSFVDLVLGVFTGLIQTITRIAMAVGFIVTAFAKLDESIFPATFAWLDTGLIGFSSLLTMEARNGNPIFLAAASWMLTDQTIRRTVAQHHARRLFLAANPEGSSAQSAAEAEHRQRCAKDGTDPAQAGEAPDVPFAGVIAGDRFVAAEVRELVKQHVAASECPLGEGSVNTAVGDESLNPGVWQHVSSRTRVAIRIGSFGQRVRMPTWPKRTRVDSLPINATMLPSPIMVTMGQLWLRWLSVPQLRPIEPWLRPDDPYISASAKPDDEAGDNAAVARFDATAYVKRALGRGGNTRMARKWHLAVTLLRNPSLVKYRKHFLPTPETDDSNTRNAKSS
uniref:Uncharacterized protein n=1 Tax=Neobodo designis TaxID=312471 RepID=A0A7S1Q3Y4_NEODS